MAGVEERIRARLEVLSDAAGIPAPPLVVVPQPEIGEHPVPAWVVGTLRPKRIAVTVPLVLASTAEQDWYLASCLASWLSPLPRRRWALAFLMSLLAFAAWQLVPRPSWEGLSDWLLHGALAVVGVVLPATLLAWSARWSRHAMEAVGLEILAATGRDPAVVAREAFGGQQPPRLGERLFSRMPSSGERIASAQGHAPRPAPPLH